MNLPLKPGRNPDSIIEWRKELPPLLLFGLMPLLCFPELFFKQYTLYQADLSWIHYPLRVFAAEEWKSGRIPLWNPYVLSGFPLLAEGQVGVLYPLNGFFLLPIPAYFSLTLFVTLHLILAAAFTYFLARVHGISRAGATLAGLVFGFGGSLMAQITNLNVMTGAVWLPLILAATVLALGHQHPMTAALGGVALALQILTSQPQIVFYTLVVVGGYALFKSIQAAQFGPARWAAMARIWALVALLGGVGLLLAAPQWLSTWELQRLSVRSAGLSYEKIVGYSLPPVQWLSLILPGVFGNNVVSAYHGVSANFEETYIYAGILPLLLALFSWRVRPRGEVIFLWLLVLVAGLLAMGGYTPIYAALYYLPGINLFRVPGRWLLVVSLGLAVLAGWGMDAFLARPAGRRLRLGLIGLWLGVTGLLGLAWLFREPLAERVASLPFERDLVASLRLSLQAGLFYRGNYQKLLLLSHLAWLTIPAAALISRLGLAVLLLVAYSAHKLSRQSFIGAALLLTVIDLALAGGSAVMLVTEADYWQRLSGGAHYLIDAHMDGSHRFFSLAEDEVGGGLGQYMPSLYRLHAASGHNSPLQLSQYSLITDLDNEFLALVLTGTRYLLTNQPIEIAARVPIRLLHQSADNWYVYEVLNALPRAFVVHQAVAAPTGETALQLLEQPNFNPYQTVILETGTLPAPTVASAQAAADEVAIVSEIPSRIDLRARLGQHGFLVLLDNYYPGWQVYVDGQPASIIRADYFARAVYLAEGSHTVQFIYRPTSFRLGLALSTLGLLILLALIGLARTNRL